MRLALLLLALTCTTIFAEPPATPKWVRFSRNGNAIKLEWATAYETNIQAFRVVRTMPDVGLDGSQSFTLGVPLLHASGVRFIAPEGLYHWTWMDTNTISTNTYFYSISASTVTGSSAWARLPITLTINKPKQ